MKKINLSIKCLVCALLLCVLAVGVVQVAAAVIERQRPVTVSAIYRDEQGRPRPLSGIEFALVHNGQQIDYGVTNARGIVVNSQGRVDFRASTPTEGYYLHLINSGGIYSTKGDIFPIIVDNPLDDVAAISIVWEFYSPGTVRPEEPTPPEDPAPPVQDPPVQDPPPQILNTLVVNQEPHGQNPTIDLRGTRLQNAAAVIMGEGTTMVPLRVITEYMGAAVAWNGELRQVTVTLPNGVIVLLAIDSVHVDGFDDLPHPPVIINDLTHVPLRFIGELLGLEVSWNPLG